MSINSFALVIFCLAEYREPEDFLEVDEALEFREPDCFAILEGALIQAWHFSLRQSEFSTILDRLSNPKIVF